MIVGVVIAVVLLFLMTFGINDLKHYESLFEDSSTEKAKTVQTTNSQNKRKNNDLLSSMFKDDEDDDDENA